MRAGDRFGDRRERFVTLVFVLKAILQDHYPDHSPLVLTLKHAAGRRQARIPVLERSRLRLQRGRGTVARGCDSHIGTGGQPGGAFQCGRGEAAFVIGLEPPGWRPVPMCESQPLGSTVPPPR